MPKLFLQTQNHIELLFSTGMNQIMTAPAQTKVLFADAWGLIFEGADKLGCANLLNNYFPNASKILVEYLKQKDCHDLNLTVQFASNISNIMEHAEKQNKEGIKQMLDELFFNLNQYIQNPQAAFPDKNREQLETFVNGYATPVDSMLVFLGGNFIDNDYLNNII